MMNFNYLLKKMTLALVLVTVLATTVAVAQTPYDEGQKALREQNWEDAAEYFEEAFESEQADAAMYWRAHALYRAGRDGEAGRQLRELGKSYPDSDWVSEGQALQIEYDTEHESDTEEEELKLFALSQLMDRDPERAMPLVMEIMRNATSPSVQRDALFILGISGQPEAAAAIAEIARNSGDAQLQMEAIHIIGATGSSDSLELLRTLYFESDDPEVRRTVVHAHIAADEAGPLVEFLKVEQDPEIQREIIHSLGAIGATEELQSVYANLSDPETKRAAIEAFGISGDTTILYQLLETETDPEIRKAAIYGLAMDGGSDATEALTRGYANATSKEEKSAILEALVILDGGEELALQVIRTETDPELQGQAIVILGILGATEELGPLYEQLNGEDNRRRVLEAMMIAGDTDGLIHILETEQDPDLRAAAINTLSVTGDERAKEYLVDMYPGGTEEVKRSVIQSMLIMDDPEGLIRLMEQESDTELRREILQTLSVMNSEEADEYLFQLLESGS